MSQKNLVLKSGIITKIGFRYETNLSKLNKTQLKSNKSQLV